MQKRTGALHRKAKIVSKNLYNGSLSCYNTYDKGAPLPRTRRAPPHKKKGGTGVKIQIIGYSGAGKSTLARELGVLYGLPVLHLDNTHFHGNWEERSDREQEALVEQFLTEHESGWVIDGNYSRIAPRRFTESDMTVFLDLPALPCFLAAWRRYLTWRGRARESCPCPEKFDRTFRRWLLLDGRTEARRQKHLENLSKTEGRQVTLKSRREIRRFLEAQANALKAKE